MPARPAAGSTPPAAGSHGTGGPTADGLPHVVVVGGGFAGLAAVRALAKEPVRVTLVDRRVYNTFQPLLYQVASGGLTAGNVTYFLRSLRLRQKNVRVLHEHLVDVDPAGRTITLLDGTRLSYDYLVLANGVSVNFYGTPGAKEHSLPMYSRSQAIKIRDQLFVRLEEAAHAADVSGAGGAGAAARHGLRIVVVGGGATGVEVAGAMAELRDAGLRPAYPEIAGEAFDVMIVQRGTEVLKTFDAPLRRYAAEQLERRGVTLRLGAGVAEVRDDRVVLTDGTQIPSDLTIWSAGVAPHEEVARWALPLGDGGRIKVGDDLRVAGHDGIFAVGDVAITPSPLPQLAQPALQSGRRAGRNIAALVAGRPTAPLRYFDKGTMAIIGRRAAIAQVFGKLHLTRGVAWLAWLFVHVMGLVGPRNRLVTLMGIVTRYGFPFHRKPVPIVGDVPSIRSRRPARRSADPRDEPGLTSAAEPGASRD